MSYDIERIKWTKLKIEDRAENEKQKSFCAVISQKNILLFNLMSNKQPYQLMFESKYGRIVDYCLFGDGYLVVGFSQGFLSHVSTHQKEMGRYFLITEQEIESERIFQGSIDAMCVNEYLYKCAVAGDQNKIKIFNMKNWKEIKKEAIQLPDNCGKVTKMAWSKNGQLLVIGTSIGYFIGMLTYLPRLFSYHQNKLAILSSFTEVNINYISDNKLELMSSGKLEIEPTVLSIGEAYLAAGMNNYVHLFRFLENGAFYQELEDAKKGDYASMVLDIGISETHMAVLTENKLFLEELESEAEPIQFPMDDSEAKIKSMFLNKEFLIMLDSENKITIYSTSQMAVCTKFKPNVQIQKFWPNALGNKAVCIDKSSKAYILNFMWESEIEIIGFTPQLNKVLWDITDPNLFIAYSSDTAYTFIHNKNYYTGETCSVVYELLSLEDVDITKDISFTSFEEVEPVLINNGQVFCLTKSNAFRPGWLGSHSSFSAFTGNPQDSDTNLRYFFQNLMLGKYENALAASTMVPEDDQQPAYTTLANNALKNMNVAVAKKAFQLADNISMVYTLDSMQKIREKKVLQGFISMIFCDYQQAQEYLLSSSRPELGLDLRCDTKEWTVALNLAENMAPDRVPLIRRRLAEDQEKQGQYQQAFKNFQSAVIDEHSASASKKDKVKQHNILCKAGIARTAVRTDSVMKGYELGQELTDPELVGEIAACLEQVKANEEAAELYEAAENYEKAATLYIATKNFKKAEKLIEKLNSPKILSSLAKMKETEGKFKEAEVAYVRAKDWESAIKLNLTKLNDFEKAANIFRDKCPTQACATILAEHCESKGMREETIQYLIMAGKQTEAFNKAQVYQGMEIYAASLEELTENEALKIAQYFEGVNKFKKAGYYYEKAGKFPSALDCYLQRGDENLEEAIECVSRSQMDALFYKMLEYLEGGDDQDPKDPKYAFKLYLTFGKIEEASRIAIAIVKTEMEEGKYKEAHKILINILSDILEKKAKVSFELLQKTIVIHSYTIIKKLIKIGEHFIAAKLLDRVCNQIKLFPQHDSAILTTAVVEASKAGLKATSFKWAATLFRPEYRDRINPNYQKNIENIARRPVKEEPGEPDSMCPFCTRHFSEYSLSCPHCSLNVPFCIASGKHLHNGNISKCPKCSYAGFSDILGRLLDLEPVCPMCDADIKKDDLVDIRPEEQVNYLKSISFGNVDDGNEKGQ